MALVLIGRMLRSIGTPNTPLKSGPNNGIEVRTAPFCSSPYLASQQDTVPALELPQACGTGVLVVGVSAVGGL
jgi:hypothetical protein